MFQPHTALHLLTLFQLQPGQNHQQHNKTTCYTNIADDDHTPSNIGINTERTNNEVDHPAVVKNNLFVMKTKRIIKWCEMAFPCEK